MAGVVVLLAAEAAGAWLLHEPLTWRELVAGSCNLGAIALVLGSPAARRADDR
jgi:uncharacterized protein (DUF486 family)